MNAHSAEKDASPEATDAFCAECLSLMVEDNGAGHLCPVCDAHPIGDCGDAFPCSGFDGKPCVLNEPLGARVTRRAPMADAASDALRAARLTEAESEVARRWFAGEATEDEIVEVIEAQGARLARILPPGVGA